MSTNRKCFENFHENLLFDKTFETLNKYENYKKNIFFGKIYENFSK
jgi:hypothetical protein